MVSEWINEIQDDVSLRNKGLMWIMDIRKLRYIS